MIAYLTELLDTLIASLSVPDSYGRWDCHRIGGQR